MKHQIKMQGECYVVETSYSLYYKTSVPVPIPEIVESLQAVERMIHRTGPFIEAGVKGIKVVNIEVLVDSLQSGSLSELFKLRLFFKTDEDYKQAQEVYDKLIRDNDVFKYLIAAGVGASLAYGAGLLAGPASPTSHIEAYNNTIINIGADMNLTGPDIADILGKVRDKKRLAKDTVAIVKPAQADPEGKIEISGVKALTINKELVSEIPKEYTPPVPEEKKETYKNAPVVIYASDRDRPTTNWAGIVPGVVNKRTRIVLADGVSPRELHGRLNINASIEVTRKYNHSKSEYEPSLIEIIQTN